MNLCFELNTIMPMKIVVLGATSPSGKSLVQQALQRGHQVTVLVRNPDKVGASHENLKVKFNFKVLVLSLVRYAMLWIPLIYT